MPTPTPTDFERLGVFYLGREYDLDARTRRDQPLLYDSRDLVTHAVCVGMTGSGKTGLCIGLLEEAAIDGVPAIVIDPKGDLTNLLLTFPNLEPADFAPWVNAEDAQRKGLSADDFAAQQASLWKKGLADWGQDGARIQRLRDAAEFAVYTPGSSAGMPVSVLRSFDPPPPAVIEDTEAFRERVSSTAMSLLALAGIESDPMTGREHILLSTILGEAWAGGKGVDLAGLIERIQKPPVQRVGVMDLETFYPSKDRFSLAMAINNLAASPGFSRWIDGEPLDIGAMLRSPRGKPRVAIFSIAHLNDAERMFFVSLLLNQTLGWVRTQSGTSSLRAILYMDEIAGYFPPTANPPSKGPLLTLMKQGRALGMGVVVATQNPVDLDYKGLSNAGTWFIGRLQTERDKARVLDGLEGAAANAAGGFDRAACDRLLSRLGSRIFLMNNVHDDGPVVFETRWAMSYLRGPLTREQIRQLDAGAPEPGSRGVEPPVAERTTPSASPVLASRPSLPPDVPQYFIPARSSGEIEYRPMLLGCAKVYYSDAKAEIETEDVCSTLVPIGDGPVTIDWEHATATDIADSDLEREPIPGARFAAVPPEATRARSYEAWKRQFADSVFRTARLDLFRNAAMREVSRPGESERDFRARLDQVAREQCDEAKEKLRVKYAPKLAALEDRKRRAEQAVAVQKEQSTSAKLGTALSVGTAILGAFFGRKTLSSGTVSRAATAARGVSRSAKEASDVGRAEENVEAIAQQLNEMDARFQEEIAALGVKSSEVAAELEKISLKPKKTNIAVRSVVLAWAPHAGGDPAW
ncbi:MAG: ATP-binding protein [Phycisphaerales bacterium]|nr:ATP-binding protein [Phycisphaerales bacterium]